MPHADIAALAGALIARLNGRLSDDMRAAIRELLDAIRTYAIDSGGDLMVAIGLDDFFLWPSTLASGESEIYQPSTGTKTASSPPSATMPA